MDSSSSRFARTRLFPRAKIDLRVIVTRSATGEPVRCTGRARDICEGGMCLLMGVEMTTDEDIWVDFTLGGVRVHAQARVRYRSGFQYGVQFTTLSSEQRDAIRTICGAEDAIPAP